MADYYKSIMMPQAVGFSAFLFEVQEQRKKFEKSQLLNTCFVNRIE